MQGSTSYRLFSPEELSNFLLHFKTMMGPYGLYQHATKRVPLLSEGYCTDDNARAVQMLVYLKKLVLEEDQAEIEDLLEKCWIFLREAEEKPGIYFNFRAAEGEWLDKDRSDDMYARLIRALVLVIDHDTHAARQQEAREKLQRLLPVVEKLNAPRAWAEIILALGSASEASKAEFNVQALIKMGVARLQQLWKDIASVEWPWFENSMTYANPIFPHGLLAAKADEEILHNSTAFLIKATVQGDMFLPIGSEGWYPKGGKPSRNNQQAIEAGMTFDFLLDYDAVFPEKVSLAKITSPYLWFFGHNSKKIMMVDEAIGACLDGIFDHGPNPNYGAESMLAYQWAEIRLRMAPRAVQNYIKEKRILTV